MLQIYNILRLLLMRRQGLVDGRHNFPSLNHLFAMKIPKLHKNSEVLWALMLWALSKNTYDDERDFFMCYMKHVHHAKSKRYYAAIEELTSLHMIVRYSNSPSIFIINPEYIPMISSRKVNRIKNEISCLDFSIIQQGREQQ